MFTDSHTHFFEPQTLTMARPATSSNLFQHGSAYRNLNQIAKEKLPVDDFENDAFAVAVLQHGKPLLSENFLW